MSVSIPSDELTPEERRAIATLTRLAKRWPQSLWIFAGRGGLDIMRCGPDGSPVMKGESVDSEQVICTINIPADGGDY